MSIGTVADVATLVVADILPRQFESSTRNEDDVTDLGIELLPGLYLRL